MKKLGILLIVLFTLSACSSNKEKEDINIHNIERKVNITIDGITYKNIKLQKKHLVIDEEQQFLLHQKIPDMTLAPITIGTKGKISMKYALKIGSRLLITSSIQIDEIEENEPLEKNKEDNN